jgi:hypothetical protein
MIFLINTNSYQAIGVNQTSKQKSINLEMRNAQIGKFIEIRTHDNFASHSQRLNRVRPRGRLRRIAVWAQLEWACCGYIRWYSLRDFKKYIYKNKIKNNFIKI